MKQFLNFILEPFGLEVAEKPSMSRPVLLGAVEPTLSNFHRKPDGAPKVWRGRLVEWRTR
jgi:hypothetical protein